MPHDDRVPPRPLRPRPRRSAAAWAAAVGLLLGVAPAARAETVEATVRSIRGDRVYLELARPVEVRLGATLQLRPGEEPVATVVVAAASKWLVVEAPGLGLAPGDALRLELALGAAQPAPGAGVSPPTEGPPAGDAPPAGGPGAVEVGRAPRTAEDYRAAPPPPRELVPFRRLPRAAGAPEPGPPAPARRAGGAFVVAGAGPAEGDPGPGAAGPAGGSADGDEAVAGGAPNTIRGEVELGVDHLSDDGADVARTTPFGRLALEVDRLGGSDRTRLLLYGSVRQPIDGEPTWTRRGEDHLIVDLSTLALEVDALPEDQVHGFTDRLELGLGRIVVPDVLAAGVVDGARAGVRFGSFTLFAFGGAAGSPDPSTLDYESWTYGGGVRFATSLAHAGALRVSLAGGQERFRSEGERDYLEGNLDARWGALGLRGQLVVDFFDTIRDKRDIRVTTGILRGSYQASADVRFEVGYAEHAPLYQFELVNRELDPLSRPVLDRAARRSVEASLWARLGRGVDVLLRGVHALGSRSMDAGGVTLGKDDLFASDRLALEVWVAHRRRGGGQARHQTEPFVSLAYTWFGEVVAWQLTVFYRASFPEDQGERRLGGRVSLDAELGHDVALRAWGEVAARRDELDRGQVYGGGLALRYRF